MDEIFGISIGNLAMKDVVRHVSDSLCDRATFEVRNGLITLRDGDWSFTFEGDGIVRVQQGCNKPRRYDDHAHYTDFLEWAKCEYLREARLEIAHLMRDNRIKDLEAGIEAANRANFYAPGEYEDACRKLADPHFRLNLLHQCLQEIMDAEGGEN